MAKRRSNANALRKLDELPALLVERVLPGAARAGARVIAQDAKARLGGKRADGSGGSKVLIADAVKVRSRKRNGLIVARVLLDGPGAYVGRWIEYGTRPHFISVDPAYRAGMTTRRINKQIKGGDAALHGTLMIDGKPVGTTVHHPGATAHPFLRPALDTKEVEAKAAAQAYVYSRITRAGIVGSDEGDDQ